MLKILKRIFGSKVVDDENRNFIDRAYQIVFNRSASMKMVKMHILLVIMTLTRIALEDMYVSRWVNYNFND